MNSLLRFLVAMAVAVVAGCGGGGGGGTSAVAPTISALSYGPTAVYVNDGGGQTTVIGTFEFSDPDGDLNTATLRVLDASNQTVFSQAIPVSGASGMTSGTLQGTVTIPTTVAGDFTIQVYVTDSHGLDSNRLSGAFRIAVFPWVAKAPMPTPRLQFATANVGGLIYVIGGQDASSTTTPKPPMTTVEVYDPASDSWSSAPSLPLALSSMMTAVVNGRIYVMGGVPALAPSTTAVEEYDPQSRIWTTVTAMPYDRYSAATAVYNGLVYVAGGSGAGVTDSTTLLIYDPVGNSWTAGAPMSQTRTGAAAAQIGGQIVAYGGRCSTCVANGGYLGSVEQYDVNMDAWTGRSGGTARMNAGVAALNGLMYAIGGGNSTNNSLDLVETYDAVTDSWSTKTAMPLALDYARAETVNNKLYVFGTNTTLEYTPANDIK